MSHCDRIFLLLNTHPTVEFLNGKFKLNVNKIGEYALYFG